MSQFKVGDVVRVVKNCSLYGQLGEVEYISDTWAPIVILTVKFPANSDDVVIHETFVPDEVKSLTPVLAQQEKANQILALVEQLDPTAIIAGGAPRDWYFGKVASDIDIFMYFRPDLPLGELHSFMLNKGFEVDFVGDQEEQFNYKLNPNIRCVFQLDYKGEKVQLVMLNKPSWGIVDTFAINICKIWYKRGKINTTKNFLFAIKNKILIKEGELYASTAKYELKIRDKFKDYTWFSSRLDAFNFLVNTGKEIQ